jgi:hypothetical protein
MGGPYELVKCNPDEHLGSRRGNMIAVYNLARTWYFTGKQAYDQTARDILIEWATAPAETLSSSHEMAWSAS